MNKKRKNNERQAKKINETRTPTKFPLCTITFDSFKLANKIALIKRPTRVIQLNMFILQHFDQFIVYSAHCAPSKRTSLYSKLKLLENCERLSIDIAVKRKTSGNSNCNCNYNRCMGTPSASQVEIEFIFISLTFFSYKFNEDEQIFDMKWKSVRHRIWIEIIKTNDCSNENKRL